MKRHLLPLVVLLQLGCASNSSAPASEDPLPTWSPTRQQGEDGGDRIYLQALVLEVPAQGLAEVRSGTLDVGVLNTALATEGSRVLQSPSLVTEPNQPASLFIGESTAGESVGLRLEFEHQGKGHLRGSFSLTDLKRDGSPYQAAKATFELKVGDRPLMVEIPGQRLISVGDNMVMQDRVFLIVVEGSDEP